MLNFCNEYCPPPQSREERAFLAIDYFHDSHIVSVEHQPDIERVVLPLWCEREWPRHKDGEDYGVRLHGVVDPPADARRKPSDPHYRNNLYEVTFEGVRHVEEALVSTGLTEYLNGRFKLSARLAGLQQGVRHRLRHFRIQSVDGYLDIVYHRVSVRRLTGKYELTLRYSRWRPFADTVERNAHRSRSELRALAAGRDEFWCAEALICLTLCADRQTVRLARSVVERWLGRREVDVHAGDMIAAVWVLGQLGGRGDLELLRRAHSKTTNLVFQRHVRDAIEWIQQTPARGQPRSAALLEDPPFASGPGSQG